MATLDGTETISRASVGMPEEAYRGSAAILPHLAGAVVLGSAVALDPGRIYHRLELAEVYADRKRYEAARAQLAEAESLPEREIRDSAYKREAGELAARLAGKR